MKVLAYSCYYTPEIAASMYLTEDIYKGIVDSGHTLEVYVPTPTRGISKELRKDYKRKKIERKFDGKLTIHRIAMYREGKNSVLRALRYIFINIAFIMKGLKTKADVIFVQSTPPTQGMMAGIIGSLKKIPVVYNLQDIFPDSLVNSGMTFEGSLIWKIGRKIEDFSYKHAKKIIVISEDFKNNILAKGVPEDKIIVVPNWADISKVYPIERRDNILIKRYKLNPNNFYITYCGNVGFTQNMDLLLDVAKDIKEELPDVCFVIIGEGAEKERIQKKVKDEQIDNVIMLPFQPYDDIAHVFSLGDVGLIISKPGVGNNSVPSKTWSIMSAEKPVLASFDNNSELGLLIKKTNCGIVAEAGDKDELVYSIRKIVNSECERQQMARMAVEYVKKYMSKDQYIYQYIKALSDD